MKYLYNLVTLILVSIYSLHGIQEQKYPTVGKESQIFIKKIKNDTKTTIDLKNSSNQPLLKIKLGSTTLESAIPIYPVRDNAGTKYLFYLVNTKDQTNLFKVYIIQPKGPPKANLQISTYSPNTKTFYGIETINVGTLGKTNLLTITIKGSNKINSIVVKVKKQTGAEPFITETKPKQE